MPGLMKRSSRELIAEMDLLKINLKYVHQVKTRIKRTITIPPILISADSDHNNDDPHNKDSSDDTPSDSQEESPSEEESFESAEEEEEVEDDLKPPTEPSDNEKSSTGHSRRSSIHSSNEKSKESSNQGGEPDQGLQSDSDDPFKESEPEPGPSGPHRSSRVPKPVFKYGSAYGDTPAVQIEKIRSERAWQKAIEPKAKAMIKQAHNTFHDDLESLVKEGGNKSIHYLLAQAVDIKKNPRELQYRNILQLKDSNPKSFQEWQIAVEAEIKALNDRNVWELVNLPQNRKPIKCRWVYDIKTNGRKRGQLVAKGFSQIQAWYRL
jgi:hypothetical protein